MTEKELARADAELPAVPVPRQSRRRTRLRPPRRQLALGHQFEAEKSGARKCPYPLFTHKFGPTHAEYLGTALERPGEPTSGLGVVRCVACGNITLETPVALA